MAAQARATWALQSALVRFTGMGCFFFLKNVLPVGAGASV